MIKILSYNIHSENLKKLHLASLSRNPLPPTCQENALRVFDVEINNLACQSCDTAINLRDDGL